MAGWAERINHTGGGDSYVPTSYHDDLLTELLQSHTAGDFCLIGGRVRVWGEGGEEANVDWGGGSVYTIGKKRGNLEKRVSHTVHVHTSL